MELNDIIKNDEDRLFIVDPECFIVFTGDSIQDNRPFIRIGTWTDLPVEIIPLIENIIITDDIIGSPSHEQFNIDIRNLGSNRYIGSESTLKRFLDYQRNFGLDLTNVSLVNVEKDIPELPKQRNISGRDQFIGVFYSNGNVKIVHDKDSIFDLTKIRQDFISIAGIHSRLSENSKSRSRYSNSGFVILDRNPLFYSGGFFTSYQYPGKYLEDFSVLGIDPAKIRELLLPSQNIINISGLMKMKNEREGKIRCFSDDSEQIELIRRLFSKMTVIDSPFSGFQHNTGDGLQLESYSGTPNLKLEFRPDRKSETRISASFIKSPVNVKEIIAEKPDLIFITYTAYENSALLFRSARSPLLIIDDGNPNIRKMKDADKTILFQGIQYEFKIFDSAETVISEYFSSHPLADLLKNRDFDSIERELESCETGAELFNSSELIKLHLNTTEDRKLYSSLKNILQNHRHRIDSTALLSERHRTKITALLCGEKIIQVVSAADQAVTEIFTDTFEPAPDTMLFPLNPETERLKERIVRDRERLSELLRLFYDDRRESGKFREMDSEIEKLKKEIADRKEIYSRELFPDFTRKGDSRKEGQVQVRYGSDYQEKGDTADPGARKLTEEKHPGRKKFIAAGAAALLLLILAVLAYDYYNERQSRIENVITGDDLKNTAEDDNTLSVKGLTEPERKILVENSVRIRDIDIYRYANDVALKNGYGSISYSGLKNKNPHWIYPENIFVMLDGERIKVRKGDTLWALARKKLERMNYEFYTIIEKIRSSGEEDARELIKKASELAYLKEQKEELERIRQGISNGR